ncbi:hypothetical protein PT974_01143 [Cladobotryum mycophilum]|uniref:Extracellular membrane protein CFEM domain-containing protein n=1 Tax=Cladobotryum mycophilum TaxID=491253 RepID=A0ABR0T4A3_9HYPO
MYSLQALFLINLFSLSLATNKHHAVQRYFPAGCNMTTLTGVAEFRIIGKFKIPGSFMVARCSAAPAVKKALSFRKTSQYPQCERMIPGFKKGEDQVLSGRGACVDGFCRSQGDGIGDVCNCLMGYAFQKPALAEISTVSTANVSQHHARVAARRKGVELAVRLGSPV